MKNMDNKGLSIIGVLLILGALIITAGGVVVWEKIAPPTLIPSPTPMPITSPVVTVGGPVAPGLSKPVKDLPTAAPVIITPFSGSADEIQVVSSKSLYWKGEEVEIQVTNNSSQTITYDLGPGCGVGFERKIDSKWQAQHLCLTCFWASSKTSCFPETIAPNTWIEITRPIETQTPLGTYRAAFQYFSGTVYSNEFVIL